MSVNSSIEWTQSTWNLVTGCTKISEGCRHCCAERMALRLQAMGQPNYENGFRVTCHEHMLDYPLRWKKPQTIFVNSMSDLFHESIPDEYVFRVFEVMRQAHWHRFQVLTKRAERMESLDRRLPWPANVWMGVTVENGACRGRIDSLRRVPAAVRFLSLEPLLSPIPEIDLNGIDWVIVGGESGPGARPMAKAWVEDIRGQCERHGAAFFFKQWGGVNKKKAERILHGRTWDGMPAVVGEHAQRFFPKALGEWDGLRRAGAVSECLDQPGTESAAQIGKCRQIAVGRSDRPPQPSRDPLRKQIPGSTRTFCDAGDRGFAE